MTRRFLWLKRSGAPDLDVLVNMDNISYCSERSDGQTNIYFSEPNDPWLHVEESIETILELMHEDNDE